MKKAKRLFALALALALSLALCAPALADGETYTITLTADDNRTDHSFTAYQIFSGDATTENGITTLSNVRWGSNIEYSDDILSAIKSITVGKNNEKPFDNVDDQTDNEFNYAPAIADILVKKASEDLAKAFAETLKTNVTGNGTSIESVSSSSTYQAKNVEAGYYLIVDTGKTNQSALMLQVVGNVSMSAKIDVPTVNKYAGKVDATDNASFSIGDDIPYTIIGTLPSNYGTDIPGTNNTYEYTFTDTIPAELDLNCTTSTSQAGSVTEGVTVYIDNNEQSGYTSNDVTKYFTITYVNNQLVISCADLTKITTIGADSKIVVQYTAKLTSNITAGKGVTNTVILETEYGDTTTETPEKSDTVFPLQLEVTKVNGDGDGLPGAKFRLYRMKDNSKEYALINADGKITSWHTDSENDSIEKHTASIVTSGEGGVFNIIGLGTGTFYLEEVSAPSGYNLLTAPVELVIGATVEKDATETKLTGITISVDESADADGVVDTAKVSANVTNQKGATLPETGGIGTTIFYVLGGILVVGAAVLLITRKRMSAVKDK